MTNTAGTEFTFEMLVEAMLDQTRTRAKVVASEVEATLATGDYDYAVRHQMRYAMRTQFRLATLEAAEKGGRAALLSRIAWGLNQTGAYTDDLSNAAVSAQQEEARDLLRDFRSFLSAEQALELIGKLY